jgi:hypothetical protein
MKVKTMKSIKRISFEKTKCISLYPHPKNKSLDGLYITNDKIITHNSTLTSVSFAYLATLFALMWAPYKYYGGAPSSLYTLVLGGYNQKKAMELLLTPILNILRQSDFFQQCRTQDNMIQATKEFNNTVGMPHVYWTTSSPTAAMQFSNGLALNIASTEGDFIGQNVVGGACTEIGFWREQAGWTDEKIMRFFTKLRDRIDSRMKSDRISAFVLDSSPNTMESVIDKWIWEEAPKSKKNYIFTGSRWKFFKHEFVGCYDDNGEIKKDWSICFPFFKGGNGHMPRAIESELDLQQFDPVDVIWAPKYGAGIDLLDKARSTPIEFMKDWCGLPSGAADRIFYEPAIIEKCFDNNLKNIFGHITAPANEEPEHLIWDQIKGLFFNKVFDKYYFYYEPGIPRSLSVDQSLTGDSTCISMSHVERHPTEIDSETGQPLPVYITDFTIVINPKGGIINLDAIKFFIQDLTTIGNMKIPHIGFDNFQSAATLQYLKRRNLNAEHLSVDDTNEPYLNYIDAVFHNRWFVGKNIYTKNNMKSIQMAKRKSGSLKIDHINGELVNDGDGKWDTDLRGINAKDCLDATVSSVQLLRKYPEHYIPYKVWNQKADIDNSYEALSKKKDNFLNNMGLF